MLIGNPSRWGILPISATLFFLQYLYRRQMQVQMKILGIPLSLTIPKHNRTVGSVWNFYSDSCFSGDWCFDSDIGSCKIQLDIICQSYNSTDFDTLFRLQFISGHSWPAACGDGYVLHQIVQGCLQFHGSFTQMVVRISDAFRSPRFQKINRRKKHILFLQFSGDFLLNIFYTICYLFLRRTRLSVTGGFFRMRFTAQYPALLIYPGLPVLRRLQQVF